MRVLAAGFGLCLAAVWLSSAAGAQEDGCCQYTVRRGGLSERRCADLAKDECAALKPVSSFSRGLKCDGPSQRCARVVPTVTPTFTFTRTITPTRTPTPQPAAQVSGCCQINNARRPGQSTCGNDVLELSCLDANTSFCEGCTCSSHSGAGFTEAQGICVAFTRTPTRTPTPTPVRAPIGCCELENLRHIDHPVCGNVIGQASCFNDYAGSPSFCLDCVCSSHSDGGFTLDDGACVTKTPTPTPTRTATPQLGCCQLDGSTGHLAVCANQVSEAACLNDRRGTPSFCADCVCSSHTEPGFTSDRGNCVISRRRPRPAARPHLPRPPRSPH